MTVLQAQKSTPYGECIGWRLQAAINAAQQASVTEALGVMRRKRIRRLPVVNRAGGLVGMVTTDDLLDLLAAELSMLAGLVVEQPIKEERTRK